MSAGKHTPGPWSVSCIEEDGYSIHGKSLNTTGIMASISTRVGAVTEVFQGTPADAGWQKISKEMTLANAQLIAAAPDLLSACQLFLTYHDAIDVEDVAMMLAYAVAEQAIRTAIAKATGGAA